MRQIWTVIFNNIIPIHLGLHDFAGHGEALEELELVIEEALGRPELARSPELTALLGDVAGRMQKALDGSARFNRWGKHYLRAITRAHTVQQATNYLDPGLQVCSAPSPLLSHTK